MEPTESVEVIRNRMLERAEVALSRRHTRQAEQLVEQLVRDDPEDARAVALLARAVASRGQLQRAIRLLRQAGAESDPDLMIELARLLAASGRLGDARQAYLNGLRQRPQSTEAWMELADVVQQQGDSNGAAEALAQAIRSDPLRQDGYMRLGEMLQSARAWDRAITVYREGLRAIPRSPELLCNLGAALLSTGRVDEAITHLSQSLSLKPVNDAALYNLGSALLERGEFDAAERRFEQLLKLRPQMADAWFKMIHCRRQQDDHRPQLRKLAQLARKPAIPETDRARMLFALGKGFDDLGDHQQAIEAFRTANEIRSAQLDYNPAHMARLTDELISTFGTSLYQRLKGDAGRGQGLVFIVGLPRSGSTLIEQVLGGHSQVATLGENDRLTDLKAQLLGSASAATVGYPQAINMMDPGLIDAVARKHVRELPVRAPLITDKTLSNYLNLGLIKLLFPAARIVHIERDPRDSGLSMYFSDFSHGHGYAFDPHHIAAHHRDHQRLMQHWRTLWPDQIHKLDYETLVSDFDTTLASLLGFLGLKPELGCAAFHERRNAVSTASTWQVRQPLYRDAVGRWQHYRDHIGPLRELGNPGEG